MATKKVARKLTPIEVVENEMREVQRTMTMLRLRHAGARLYKMAALLHDEFALSGFRMDVINGKSVASYMTDYDIVARERLNGMGDESDDPASEVNAVIQRVDALESAIDWAINELDNLTGARRAPRSAPDDDEEDMD